MAAGALARRIDWLKLTFLEGGPGQCIFAINNACNAACDFCRFNRDRLGRESWEFADMAGAKAASEILYKNGIHYLILTGGEPMLHPGLLEIMAHASSIGMKPLLVTNGSRLTLEGCSQLVDSGLSSVFISIDAPDAKAHEKNRGLPGVCEKITRANAYFRESDVQSTASMTISRLINDFERIPDFLEGLGFSAVTFSYPLTHLESSFLGYADSKLVDFTPEELDRAFEAVLKLKRRFQVANPAASIRDMRAFLKNEPQRFECLGGYKYFYMDWKLMLWRCHHWEKPMGPILKMDRLETVRDGCQKCMIDCMRDPSVLQHVAVSVADAAGHLRRGELPSAARALWNRKNATSLRSVGEELAWITRL